MADYYGMDGKPITLEEWLALVEGDFEKTRRVANDEVHGCTVSTVLLGIDHSFMRQGPPLIFETMIFGDELPPDLVEYQERYSTREQALEGHRRAIDLVHRVMLNRLRHEAVKE